MKKIISCTLAASIAGTSIATIKPEGVQAVEDNLGSNDSSSLDKVDVKIENTEEIKEESSNNTNANEKNEENTEKPEVSEDAKEESSEGANSGDDGSNDEGEVNEKPSNDGNVNTDSSTGSDTEEDSNKTENKEEISEENTDKSEENTDNNENEEDIDKDGNEEVSDKEGIADENAIDNIDLNEEDDYQGEAVGKLELDMSFPMPLSNSDELDIQVSLNDGSGVIGTLDLSKGIIDKSADEDGALDKIISKIKNKKSKTSSVENKESGELAEGITYKIEKFNFLREPLKDGDSVYYIKVTFDGLSKGTYSLDVEGSGYTETSVSDIEIQDYSKRVKLGSAASDNGYNPVLLAGDINKDSVIDMEDYKLVFNSIGKKINSKEKKKYDLNRDGKVDIADLSIIYNNIGKEADTAVIENTDKIIDVKEISAETNTNISESKLKSILVKDDAVVELGRTDGEGPSEENPITMAFDLGSAASARNGSDGIEMEQVVIKVPEQVARHSDDDENGAGAPEAGFITYTDENGEEHRVEFNADENMSRSSGSGDIVIDLGSQVAVKQISINVTANRGNKKISQIAKIEFLNNVYKELPKPAMNIPVIETLETSTEMHDERITITWEPQPNVTSYEVKYDRLDASGNVVKTKKLQTNKTEMNILDKDIKPYDFYRVSVQSLNGEWESGYEENVDGHTGYDGVPDNVDENFLPLESYYNGKKGSVTEVQVIPLRAPEVPRNLTTVSGYKSFTVSWEDHRQARDFDIYYRKVGSDMWTKANEEDANGNRLVVSENSPEVTNPDKSKQIRSHKYTINNLEDSTIYEVRVTATNHFGTSKMSETYIASTVSILEPTVPQYKLINKTTSENEIGTTHIVDVRNKLDENGWANEDGALTYDSKYSVVDGDFTTSMKVKDWDMGAIYGSNRGPEITFDDKYEIGKIILTKTFEQGFGGYFTDVKVTYWDENNQKQVINTNSIVTRTSNGQQYHIIKLDSPIKTSKIKVETAGGGWQTISELMFYEYDSLEDDIKNLYTDNLRVQLREDVQQEDITKLFERANTKDAASDEYHPERDTILKELENAQKLFNDKEASTKITSLDASIRTDNVGPSLGMENSYQSLGSVARPNGVNAAKKEKIIVYMGSTDANTKVDIAFLQNYGQPGAYISRVTTISPGITEIEIPNIVSENVEKGGQVMARVTAGSTSADIKIRLSNVEEIPSLNVNNLINNPEKVDEVKGKIRTYIGELKTYVAELPGKYPDSVTPEERVDNIYTYDAQTSVLNTTDIEGDRFTLTLPATEIHRGIVSGIENDEDKQVERVYNALLAWEQEIKVGYAKKGVFEEVQDFNKSGEIDNDDRSYFNKHKAPLTRLNVKYQRMMMGAAAYASSHHIGVGFNSAEYIQGVPYKFDEDGTVTNKKEARLYGELMGHEIGHAMDIRDRLYPETSNNLLASVTSTMLNEDDPKTSGARKELYEKVTSNTVGLSTNRSVVLGMLWQPHLAYEDKDTNKMLLTNFDGDTSNDSYFAKLNRAYREMTAEERADADRDQLLIRMTSKVTNKNLSNFYVAHGIIPNATTLQYVSQFDEETRPIQYINDEARRMRLAGNADMAEGTVLTAKFADDAQGNKITDGSYVNSKEVKINLSVNQSNDKILGYEIYRNGLPCGFVERDKENDVTVYTDMLESINNRVVEYKAVAYDYNLKATEEVELGTVKVRHDGGVAKNSIEITSNTLSLHEESNDIHGDCANKDLKLALDNKPGTHYEGRMLERNEYNSSIHDATMNPNNDPYILLDTTEVKTLVGLKYTAPTTESGFIFKRAAVDDSAIKKYEIQVSKDGQSWTTVKTGTMSVTAENPTETIYFDAEGVTGGKQLNSYNARYVRIKALGTKKISAAELELITPPGDNIEIGVSEDNINYKNGIGRLSEEYVYESGNAAEGEKQYKAIPKGSIIITGEYRGNPAFNVPLVLNQNDKHIADEYHGLLFAEIPDNGNLEEISKGNWVYWVEPKFVDQFIEQNQKIFAELYRTDSADAQDGGQRLVSDTFKIEVPEKLPEISLSKNPSTRASKSLTTLEIDEDLINSITNNR